ncbi:MAG: YecA family protein [Phycisphaerae bacterium]
MTPMMEEFMDVLPGLSNRYRHLRAESRLLNNEIAKTFDKDTILRAAKMLGMLHGKTITGELELASELIPEFATYGVFTDGENLVQRFRCTHPQADPVRQMILDAKSQAIFTFIGVVETYPTESAMVVEDLLLDNQRMLLADGSLSAGAAAGDVICARMIHVEPFWMTTGLGMSMGMNTRDPALLDYIATGVPRILRTDPDNCDLLHGEFAAAIVKMMISDHRECDEYEDNGSDTNEVASEPVELLQSQRVERNAPCPCGSGKKYKKCCGR